MIDLLIPVLRRPQNAQPLVDSIQAATKREHRIVFIVSPDDDEQIVACRRTGSPMIRSPRPQYAPKINLGASLTQGEFIFVGADDLRFHPGWEERAIERWEETGKPVVGTNDLGNPTVMAGEHATHCLVHRSYLAQGTIDEPGKLVHDGYEHNWVDNEFIETAKFRDAWTFAADSLVEHLHPFWRKGPDDEVYVLGRESYNRDRQLFLKRRRLIR